MKLGVVAVVAALSTLAAGTAHAQWADLNGQYRCVGDWVGPGFPFITMQGWDMNLVNEAGLPSRLGGLSRPYLGGKLGEEPCFAGRTDCSVRQR